MIVGILGTLVAVAIQGLSEGAWALFWIGVIVAVIGWAVWLTQYGRFTWQGN